jgi:hypothetical protein
VRAKLINENISFERGKDPKEVLGIEDPFIKHLKDYIMKSKKEIDENNFEYKKQFGGNFGIDDLGDRYDVANVYSNITRNDVITDIENIMRQHGQIS